LLLQTASPLSSAEPVVIEVNKNRRPDHRSGSFAEILAMTLA
jgi:hypothetical protein